MTERNHVPQVPHLRSPFLSEISETFGADRDVRINLVVLSYVRDTNQTNQRRIAPSTYFKH